jgi:hypothetical protein
METFMAALLFVESIGLVLRKVELVFVQEWMWFFSGLMIASCERPTIEYVDDVVDQTI